jgi:cell wall-associated NlpC family hydrolase
MIASEMIVELARSWIGTPYHHQARGPKGSEGGTDCVGLLIGVGIELGIIPSDYDPTGYAWETDGIQLTEELLKWADPIFLIEGKASLEAWSEIVQPGDILTFRIVGLPQHTAFASEIDYGGGVKVLGMIHAYNPQDKVIEHRLDDRWATRMIGCWRLRG